MARDGWKLVEYYQSIGFNYDLDETEARERINQGKYLDMTAVVAKVLTVCSDRSSLNDVSFKDLVIEHL